MFTFVSTSIVFFLIIKCLVMTKNAKIALIIAGVVAVSVGGYLGYKAYQKKRRKSGNAQKDNRRIVIK